MNDYFEERELGAAILSYWAAHHPVDEHTSAAKLAEGARLAEVLAAGGERWQSCYHAGHLAASASLYLSQMLLGLTDPLDGVSSAEEPPEADEADEAGLGEIIVAEARAAGVSAREMRAQMLVRLILPFVHLDLPEEGAEL